MIYEIYQNKAFVLYHDTINRNLTKALEIPMVAAKYAMLVKADAYTPEMFKHYAIVGTIEAESNDEVYKLGNIGYMPPGCPSLGVGDIIYNAETGYEIVDFCGFKSITIER